MRLFASVLSGHAPVIERAGEGCAGHSRRFEAGIQNIKRALLPAGAVSEYMDLITQLVVTAHDYF